MSLAGKRVGVAMAASHCNLQRAMDGMRTLVSEGADITPIFSHNVRMTSTRFGQPEDWLAQAEAITGKRPLTTIPEVEPFGPRIQLDCMLVMPCTGNTVAKLANAINDTPVCMAVKAQLRNSRPVVLAVTSNDLLGLNARNLGTLLATKHVFFVPFAQDNPQAKPNSLDARIEAYLVPTLEAALQGRQLQPILLGPPG